jgi:hypothetical protein
MKKNSFTLPLFITLLLSVFAYSQSSNPSLRTLSQIQTRSRQTPPPPDTTEDSSMKGTSLNTQQEDTTTVDTSYDDSALAGTV